MYIQSSRIQLSEVQSSPCRNNSLSVILLQVFFCIFHIRTFVVRYIRGFPSPLLRFYRKLRDRSRGTTVNAVPIPAITAVFVIMFNPITAIRYYHGITVIPVPMQLSSIGDGLDHSTAKEETTSSA